jgi:hypothetical protein
MCLTCDNFKRDLTASGSVFKDFYGLHFYGINVVDVSYNTGSLHCKNDTDLMIECLRTNGYSFERIEIWMLGDDCIIDLHKLRDTRIGEKTVLKVCI